jgi:hypothetical protein
MAEEPRYAPNLVIALLTGKRIDESLGDRAPPPRRPRPDCPPRLLAARTPSHPIDVFEPYQQLIERHVLDSGDKWRYKQALKVLPSVRPVYRALGDDDGWTEYFDDLRDRHRIRPAFVPGLAAWQDGTSRAPRTTRPTT